MRVWCDVFLELFVGIVIMNLNGDDVRMRENVVLLCCLMWVFVFCVF